MNVSGRDHWIGQTRQAPATLASAAEVQTHDLSDIPADMTRLLFPDDAGTVFAILDAAKLPGLPEILIGAGLDHACLYQGDMADRLADVAPYLVVLPADASLLEKLLTKGAGPWDWWDNAAALFLQSQVALSDLRQHFRKFVHVPDGQGGYAFLRFWEPDLLAALATADQSGFGLPYRLFGPVARFIAPDPAASQVITLTPNAHAPHTASEGRIAIDTPFRQVLRGVMRQRFAREMATHCAGAFPDLMRNVPTPVQIAFAATAAAQAGALGLTKRAPVFIWGEATALLGSGLAQDPQYRALCRMMDGVQPATQMQVADKMHHWIADYVSRVLGPGNAFFRAALGRMHDAIDAPEMVGPQDLLVRVWPEKCRFLGLEAVDGLIGAVISDAAWLPQMPLAARRVYLLACFTMGRSCASDPLAAWIQTALAADDPGAALVAQGGLWLDATKTGLDAA